MAELGLDISGETPKRLTDDMALRADVIVTMGCGDACPVYPGKRYVDWELPDPAGKELDEVRRIRDDIALRVDRLISEVLDERGGTAFGPWLTVGRRPRSTLRPSPENVSGPTARHRIPKRGDDFHRQIRCLFPENGMSGHLWTGQFVPTS